MQGFQAAANIAQDLDERPMPKGPLFPKWVPLTCSTHLSVGFDVISDVGGAVVLRLLHSSLLYRVASPPRFLVYLPVPTTQIITTYVVELCIAVWSDLGHMEILLIADL